MNPSRQPRHLSWLALSLLSLVFIGALISYEAGWLYPRVERYFESEDSQTERQLAARAREHLLSSLVQLAEPAPGPAAINQAHEQLDHAYAFLNIRLYRERYACTDTALWTLDRLSERLQGAIPTRSELLGDVLPVLRCVDEIEVGQNRRRSELTLNLARELDDHRRIYLVALILFYCGALAFWFMHERRHRAYVLQLREKMEWRDRAQRDALTGIFNRRALDEDLKRYHQAFEQQALPFALLIFDIDFFKQYNDALGHPAGDAALRAVVITLGGVLRDDDRLYRYGGEEIAVLLPNTGLSAAREVGERAIRAVFEADFQHPDSPWGVLTISGGVAAIDEGRDSCADVQALMEAADRSLYQAKRGGRNRICGDSPRKAVPA